MSTRRRVAGWALFLVCDFFALWGLAALLAAVGVPFWPRLGLTVAAGVAIGLADGYRRTRR